MVNGYAHRRRFGALTLRMYYPTLHRSHPASAISSMSAESHAPQRQSHRPVFGAIGAANRVVLLPATHVSGRPSLASCTRDDRGVAWHGRTLRILQESTA